MVAEKLDPHFQDRADSNGTPASLIKPRGEDEQKDDRRQSHLLVLLRTGFWQFFLTVLAMG